MSWAPTKSTIPNELAAVLYEDDSDGDDEWMEMELVEGSESDEDVYEDADIADMPVPIADGDGELHAMPVIKAEAPLDISGVQDPGVSSDDDDTAHQRMLRDISPLTIRSSSPAAVSIDHQAGPSWGVPGRGRRGRGRGRGRGRVGARSHWFRGHPLQERYATDEDVPGPIRSVLNLGMRGVNVSVASESDDVHGYDVDEAFNWRGMSEFNGEREPFLEQSPGPTTLIDNAYDAVHSIWNDDIVGYIVNETNRYAQEIVAKRARFAKEWFATNLHEMWIMFAFWLMLGIVKMPTIKSCFTNIPLLRTDVFRSLFTEGRYWNLNAAFHLNEGRDANEALHPMGPVIDHLNERFQAMYRLDREICIDESLTLWKGPVRFRQYIKTKAAKFGIKTYQLCESATGYLYKFFIYTAAQPTRADDISAQFSTLSLPSSERCVIRLIWPLLNRGHTLFMDNWFNSPTLARWLKRHKTDCVGTLKPCKKQVPMVVQKCPLAEGQFVARCSDGVVVLALQDRKRVTCVSTCHDVSQVRKEPRPGHSQQYKLKLIDDYNRGMGGVDRLDQMLEPYLVERKQCKKWNRKFFKRLLNISIQNARIVVEKSTNKKLDALAFRLSLAQQIIDKHLPHVPRQPAPTPRRTYDNFPPGRLTERHFIQRIPITEAMRQNTVFKSNLGRRNCVWCTASKRIRKTSYECPECEVALCIGTCFREFHTLSTPPQ